MGNARALVLEAPRRLVETSFAIPDIGDDDAVLRVEACGLCGTDHEQYTGAMALRSPVVPGHESVGVIDRIGPRAAERWGVGEGDRVAVEVFRACGSCDACASGGYMKCASNGLGTAYGFSPVSRDPSLWGGYATHQYLAPDSLVHPVPEGMDPVVATLFNPLGAGVRWAATVGGIGPGDIVAVLGPGVRGLSALVAAREAGAGFVAVTGTDRDADRLEVAARFGADLVVDVTDADPVTALREAAGGLADVVVDVTANAPAAFAQGVSLLRDGGRMVVAGTRGFGDVPGFSPDVLVYKEAEIVGAFGVDAPAYRRALDLLSGSGYPFAEIPRRTATLGGAEALLQQMAGEGAERPLHAVITP